jgi:hypothetical protein
LAAIVAGVLRAIASFVPDSVPYAERQTLYGLTDTFIIFGIVGAYSWRHREAGILGFCGFVLAVAGLGSGNGIYAVRALLFTAGLNLLGASWWKTKSVPRWILAFWAISSVIGVIGYFGNGVGFLFVLAGLMFGIGFAGMGVVVWMGSRF